MGLIIKKLQVENFGIYQGKHEFEFNEGLNLIQAGNGFGKSLLFHAISMLLADDYIGSYEDYLNTDINASFFNICLFFSFNSIDYKILLSVTKSKTTTKADKRTLEIFNTTTNKWQELGNGDNAKFELAKILDPVITRYSLIAKQENIDNIVKCKDSERRDLFKKIRDLDYEKDIALHIDPKIKAIKDLIIELEKKIYNLEHMQYPKLEFLPLIHTKEEIDTYQVELELIEKEMNLFQLQKEQYDNKQKELSSLQEKLLKIEILLKEKGIKEEESYMLLQTLQSESYQIEKQKEYDLAINKIKEDSKNEEESLKNKINKLNTLLVDIQTKNQLEIESIQNKIDAIKIVKIAKYDSTNLDQLSGNLISSNKDLQKIEKDISFFKEGKCPTCGSNCTHKLEEFEIKKEEIVNTIQQMTKDLEIEKNNKKENEDKLEQIQKDKIEKDKLQDLLNTKIKEATTNQDIYQNQINSIEKEIKKNIEFTSIVIQEKEKQKESVIKNIESLIEKEKQIISNYMNERISLKNEQDEVSNNIDIANTWLKNHENDNKFSLDNYGIKIFDLSSRIQTYNEITIKNELISKQIEEQEKQKKNDIINLDILKKEKQKQLTEQYNLEQARKILLTDFPNYVIDNSVEDLENNMNLFIDNVFYKSLNVSLRATKTSIKLEYGKENNKLPASRLSGAESKLVSLAFINNFNQLIGLSCLLLDEPDAAMASDTANSLYEALINMQDVYKQTIIITHSSKMVNYLTSNIENHNIIRL